MCYDWNDKDSDLPYNSRLLNLATMLYESPFVQWIDTVTGQYGVVHRDPHTNQTIVDRVTGEVRVDVFQMDPRHMWIEWGNQPPLTDSNKVELQRDLVTHRCPTKGANNESWIETTRQYRTSGKSYRKAAMIRLDEPHDPPEPASDTWRDRPPLL